MPNVFQNPEVVSKLATLALYRASNLPRATQSQTIEAEYLGRGDQLKPGGKLRVKVRRPIPADRWDGKEATLPGTRDVEEAYHDVHVLGQLYSRVKVSQHQLALEVDDFAHQVVGPQIMGMVEEFSTLAWEVASQGAYWSGTLGNSPTNLAQVEAIHERMTTNKCPRSRLATPPFSGDDGVTFSYPGRMAMISSKSKTSIWGSIPQFHNANQRGDGGAALLEGEIGKVGGFLWSEDATIPLHTPGTMQAGVALINGAVAAGAKKMAIDGGIGTETIKAGDFFAVAGVTDAAGNPRQFVIRKTPGENFGAADWGVYTATGGAFSDVEFYPAAPPGGFPDNAVITFAPAHHKDLAMLAGYMTFGAFPGPPDPDIAEVRAGFPSATFFDEDTGMGFNFSLYKDPGRIWKSEVSTFAYGAVTQAELGCVIGG